MSNASLQTDKEVAMALVTQHGCSLVHVDASFRADRDVVMASLRSRGWDMETSQIVDKSLFADKEVVMTAVNKHGVALRLAATSLKADKEVGMVAVTNYGFALAFADASLQADLEVQLVAARNGMATEALALVIQLRKLSDWEEQDVMLGRAVEMLAYFPLSAVSPEVYHQLHDAVEGMVRQAYRPGLKRDRDAFEREVSVF